MFLFLARKLVEATVPITRSDNDIEVLLTHPGKKLINNVLDMFVLSQLPVHILRGVEPNLRYGSAIRNYINKNYDNSPISKCYQDDTDVSSSSRDDKRQRHKCIHLASRKQIGDAIIRYEDKSIIHK